MGMAGALGKVKLPTALMEAVSNRYLQRCTVSGTPKGKKTGQVLKRTKITRKKTTPSSSSAKPTDFDNLAVECLNAPSPLRHLTAKQRAREEEREKMGLFSRDRKREMEMMKERERRAQNQEDEDEAEEEEEAPHLQMGAPGLDFVTIGMVDIDKVPKYELTAEDGKRLAKQYSRVLMLKHRRRQNAETTLLRLKKEAIQALPLKLKEAAMVPDFTPFPPGRIIPSLTPPIEGYADSILHASKKRSDMRVRRS